MINTLEKKQIGPKRTFRDRLFDYSCQKIGKEKTKVFFKLYDLSKFDIFGKPRGAIGAIDITNRCNLRCKHCYFYAQDYEARPELTDDEWIEKLESLKEADFPFYQCSWIGESYTDRAETGNDELLRDITDQSVIVFNFANRLQNAIGFGVDQIQQQARSYYAVLRSEEHTSELQSPTNLV